MITIRPYQKADWPMIDGWWKRSGEIGPLPSMMPEESSFVAECDSRPALAVAVYLTNTPEVAYCENFIGNPDEKSAGRQIAAHVLADYVSRFARERGYKRLLCFSEKPALMKRYQELGFAPTLSGVTAFVRST